MVAAGHYSRIVAEAGRAARLLPLSLKVDFGVMQG
jgi:hypothetical protein